MGHIDPIPPDGIQTGIPDRVLRELRDVSRLLPKRSQRNCHVFLRPAVDRVKRICLRDTISPRRRETKHNFSESSNHKNSLKSNTNVLHKFRQSISYKVF